MYSGVLNGRLSMKQSFRERCNVVFNASDPLQKRQNALSKEQDVHQIPHNNPIAITYTHSWTVSAWAVHPNT
jgi:hypothetical protein